MKSKQTNMIEVDTEKGKKLIPRHRACFSLRQGVLRGVDVLIGKASLYEKTPSGALIRLDKKKLSKAEKKALKKQKVKLSREGSAV